MLIEGLDYARSYKELGKDTVFIRVIERVDSNDICRFFYGCNGIGFVLFGSTILIGVLAVDFWIPSA